MSDATLAASLLQATRLLAAHSESPRLDAELLLCKVLDLARPALIVRGAEPLRTAHRERYAALLARRVRGEPVAYLTGTREFWSLPLAVSPAVLVPRPETELLVELALARLPTAAPRAVLDLGTGSGAVALAIASERPQAHITGIDVSPTALLVAEGNARRLRLAQVDWRLGSWFDAVPGERFDLVVGNPPYVAGDDSALAALSAEPSLALSPGPTGLEALTLIVAGAAAHLKARGWLLLEHGRTQAEAVALLFERGGFGEIQSCSDYAGNPRVTLGTLVSSH